MTFSRDRSGWKKPGPRITPERYDAIVAALKERDSIEQVATRFNLSAITVSRMAERMRP